jgi:hypothetical protein
MKAGYLPVAHIAGIVVVMAAFTMLGFRFSVLRPSFGAVGVLLMVAAGLVIWVEGSLRQRCASRTRAIGKLAFLLFVLGLAAVASIAPKSGELSRQSAAIELAVNY